MTTSYNTPNLKTKMKILYNGPFQSNNAIGYCSASILEDICKYNQIQTYAYPIYSGYDDEKSSTIPYLRMSELSKMPDAVISHCLIETASINLYTKNYLIPITQQDLSINIKHRNKLKEFDGIFVFNDFDYEKFLDIGISDSNIFKIPYPQSTKSTSQHKLDLGIYSSYKKYYFIGNYDGDKASIKSLIPTFIDCCNQNDHMCLIICCETNSSNKKDLISYYEQCKSDLHTNKEDKVLLMLDNLSHSRLSSLHSSADIFLSINNQYELISNCSLASKHNNTIISYGDLDLDKLSDHNQTRYTIIKKSLKENILSHKKAPSKYPISQLADILC